MKLLGELVAKKVKERDETDWNELRRCYENERHILQNLIDGGVVDL
jgi:hypothetical protein